MTDLTEHLEAQLRPDDAPDQPQEGWGGRREGAHRRRSGL